MNLSNLNDFVSMSNIDICEEIIQTENKLFNLRFKKATQQAFKSHEFKHTRRRLAQLKTILTLRLDSFEERNPNILNNLTKKN